MSNILKRAEHKLHNGTESYSFYFEINKPICVFAGQSTEENLKYATLFKQAYDLELSKELISKEE